MKKKQFLLLCLVLLTSASFSQEIKMNSSKPFIEVTGVAEKKIIPDEIYMSITIKERETGKDKVTVEQQEKDLKKALDELKISLDNLSVSDAQADYIRVKFTKKNVVSQSEYELKLATAQQVAEVLEKLDNLKMDNAFISKVSHSKIKEYKKEIEIEAIKNAKIKAEYLMKAIGQDLGSALEVHEKNDLNYNVDDFNVRGSRAKPNYYLQETSKSELNDVVDFKKIRLEAKVIVKFEIK